MILKELIDTLDIIFYSDKSYYKNIISIQNELLKIIPPDIDIKKINHVYINSYIGMLKHKNNDFSTLNVKMSYLRSLLKYAFNNDLIHNIPVIPSFKVISKEKTPLNKKDILKMLVWCKQNNEAELRKIIHIGYYTGARIQNILDIQSSHIESGYVRFWKNKTNYSYSVPIKRRLQVILNKKFKPFKSNYQHVYYVFNLMRQALNLDSKITIHTLRHTFCSNLIKKDVDISIAKELMNHSSIQTTMLYNHIANKQLEKAIKSL